MSEQAPETARVLLETSGVLATVTLNAPKKLNVLDGEGWSQLAAVMGEVSRDDSLRCVILQGAGVKAFSAGSDIGDFEANRDTPAQVRAYGKKIHEALRSIQDCVHPTVAVIHGLCVGGGLEIAACCDLRLCGESSRFGAPISRLGLTMAYEELEPLVGLLGPGAVLDVLLTGDLIDSEAALRMGLVNRVVTDADVAVAGRTLGERISRGAPLVNRWHKSFIRRMGRDQPLTEAERAEAYEAFQTEDYREGRTAFVEKRPPRFEGK